MTYKQAADIRAKLAAHRAQQRCEHCGAWPKQRHDRSCPTAKKAKSSVRAGKDWEREVARRLNGLRIGQYGGKSDVQTSAFNVQCKVGPSYFSRWVIEAIDALPADGRCPVVVIGDRPGSGTKRRAYICLDLDDFVDLMGGNQ
jgi:hypothetical protein